MTVRALTDNDFAQLLKLIRLQDEDPEFRVMSPEGRSEEELSLELSSSDPFNEMMPMVLEEDGKIKAYASLCVMEGEAFLEGPLMPAGLAAEAVKPLLDTLVREAKARDLGFLEAFVEDRNERAQEALRLAGFAPFRTTYIYEIGREEAPKYVEAGGSRFDFSETIDAARYRELYRETSDAWASRLAWTDEELEARFQDPRVKLVVAYENGKPVGHIELELLEDGTAEIAYFGVLPEARGQGLGHMLLKQGLRRAFQNPEVEVVLARAHDDERAACHAVEKVGFRLAHGVIAFTLELDAV
jgi:ribosomal protein S18 acetylase RimI-like enzyme